MDLSTLNSGSPGLDEIPMSRQKQCWFAVRKMVLPFIFRHASTGPRVLFARSCGYSCRGEMPSARFGAR